MAYVDMVHSHVQRLLQEALALDSVEQDEDGDYTFWHGGACCWVQVHPRGLAVRVRSCAVNGVKPTVAVLRELNAANMQLLHARAFIADGAVIVDVVTPSEELSALHLGRLCREVGEMADKLGSLIATVHGGVLAEQVVGEPF